jgi:hypothetical protein
VIAGALAVLLAATPAAAAQLPLRACVVQNVPARCGTVLVPENRETGLGRKIGLRMVVGGADPQDPVGNLAGLGDAMPNSRIVVAPGQGHGIGDLGCLPDLVGRFVDRGSAASLDVRCARRIPTPAFVLR